MKIYKSYYYISNAHVKQAHPKHRTEECQRQWAINSRTIIKDTPDDDAPLALELPKYNIASLADTENYKYTDAEIGN